MRPFELIAILIVLTALFSYINVRLLKLPPTIGLMALSLLFAIALVAIERIRADGRGAGPRGGQTVRARPDAVARHARFPAVRRGAPRQPGRPARITSGRSRSWRPSAS